MLILLLIIVVHSVDITYILNVSFECKFVRRIQMPPLCWNSCQKRTNFASFWPFFVPRLWRMMSRLVFESYLYTTVFGYALFFFHFLRGTHFTMWQNYLWRIIILSKSPDNMFFWEIKTFCLECLVKLWFKKQRKQSLC